MICIKNLTIKNFMSVGAVSQAVNFSSQNLTLILGENLDQGGDSSKRNAVGKTAIINALSYALYGQALTNIKRDNLVNNINGKGMLVTLSFEKDGVNYRVERGRRPSIFRLFVNDVEQDVVEQDESQGDTRETQRDLTMLLGMSHDVFTHIIALNTYTEPFLSMRSGDQRSMIEQLLGITVLSDKAAALKEQIRITKENILKETAIIDSIQASNQRIQQSISTLQTKQLSWSAQHQSQIAHTKKAIIDLEDIDIDQEIVQHSTLAQYRTQQSTLTALEKEKKTLANTLAQIEKSLSKYQADLAVLKEHKCHACGQSIHDATHQEVTQSKQTQFDDALSNYQATKTKLTDVINAINSTQVISIPSTFYTTLEDALKHQTNLAALREQLSAKLNETSPYQEQVDELQNTALQNIDWTSVNQLDQVRLHQEFLLKLLTNKDSFIRKKIIDQNLTYLNSRLTHYLSQLNLPHIVTFQNDLTVNITQLGKDLDFGNLSRGERTRLVISLSFAFRDLWENLQSSVNLLFIDEMLDMGLDSSGVEHAFALLKQVSRDRQKNIFLISHKDELISRVSSVFKVVKSGGFTSFENDAEVLG